MYRLTRDLEMNNIGNLIYGYKQNDGKCVLMTILKIIIVLLVLRWIYKRFICKLEFFDVSKPVNEDKKSLHDILTANCKPEYCNTSDWSSNKTVLPEGYSLGNMSTVDGCCIIPTKLLNYINVSHGNNRVKMDNVNSEIKMDSYIRD